VRADGALLEEFVGVGWRWDSRGVVACFGGTFALAFLAIYDLCQTSSGPRTMGSHLAALPGLLPELESSERRMFFLLWDISLELGKTGERLL
jgi:hypothetical protein